jgi:serine/threonine protein kinase
MANEFQPGEVVNNRYEVQKLLGRGGMGMVYLVMDYDSQQMRALKTLLPQYVANERALQRFNREINACRRLNHPSIVKVYDAQHLDKLVFYTMDYIEGKSLRRWMQQRGKLGLGSTVRIICLLCDALEHAHQFTIHRDLSPDNVMVLSDGSIKLLDFGLAKITDADDGLTRIGVSLGKAQYNSPEQRASAAQVDLRTDIFAIGIMFFEMLTGNVPKRDQKPTDARADLPRECDDFYLKCTAWKPADRYQSVAEIPPILRDIYNRSQGSSPTAPPQPLRHIAPLDEETVVAATATPGLFERCKIFIRNILRRKT